MKKNIIAVMLCFVGLTYSQTGINTDQPKTTLEIVGKPDIATAIDGLLIPKISGLDLKNKTGYNSTHGGTLIYVTSALTGSNLSGQVVAVNKVGFYYFDGSVLEWKPIDTNTNPGNLYLNNGSLSEKRTVSQNKNKLIFTDDFDSAASTSTVTSMLDHANNSITFGASGESDTNPSLVLNPVIRRTGINISQPKATLEIHPAIFSEHKVEDGIIIPRLAKAELNYKMNHSSNPYTTAAVTNYAAIRNSHVGTLLYVFNGASTPSSLNASLANVTSDGFYYLDENRIWQKLLNTANTTAVISSIADTSKDSWVDNSTNTRVELGTTSTGAARTAGNNVSFHDNGRLNLGFSGSADAGIHLVGDTDGWKDDIRLDSYDNTVGGAPNFRFHSSRGTQSAAISSSIGDNIGQFNFYANTASVGINTPTWTQLSRISSFYRGSTKSDLRFYTSNSSSANAILNEDGNVGIGTTSPTNRLHVVSASNPIKLGGVQAGTFSDNLVAINTSGELKSIPSLNALGMPTPAIFKLDSDITDFLNGVSAGDSSAIKMSLVKNAIPGLTYDITSGEITLPAGVYQLSMIYEGEHNATGCTISSYMIDFPFGNSGNTRIHNTASHNQGALSNHGGTISYSTVTTAERNWTIHLGRGQSGNCSGAGMKLKANSTQLVILRMGT